MTTFVAIKETLRLAEQQEVAGIIRSGEYQEKVSECCTGSCTCRHRAAHT